MTLHTGAAEDDNSNFFEARPRVQPAKRFSDMLWKAPFLVAEVIKDEVKIKEHNTSNI